MNHHSRMQIPRCFSVEQSLTVHNLNYSFEVEKLLRLLNLEGLMGRVTQKCKAYCWNRYGEKAPVLGIE